MPVDWRYISWKMAGIVVKNTGHDKDHQQKRFELGQGERTIKDTIDKCHVYPKELHDGLERKEFEWPRHCILEDLLPAERACQHFL